MKSKHKITDKTGKLIPVPFGNRKSIIKHAITGQRTQTLDADNLEIRRATAIFAERSHAAIGRNGYHVPQPQAQNRLTPDFNTKARFAPRNQVRNRCVPNVPSKGRIYSGESVAMSHKDWQQKMERA